MSEALYRKYRPQTFEDVVGQTHIERTLKNAIESDKVSHAYLFCGPRGTGKTTTARLLAKALLCDDGPTPSPDGTCEQCLAIAEGTHPDVNEMDAASRTGVENVREEIIGRVQYAPTRGRYKIYIIDEVHMLSTAAFNALLKTLEEPPDHVVFILCTTDPQKVPETIHSRCQRFDFHRLSNEEIVSRLGAVCMAEGVQFEGDALDLVAHRAQGGMRDALTTLEQLIAFGNGAVTMEVARNVLGALDTDDMTAIVDAIAARDAAACFVWVSEYIETGADLAQFTRDLAAYVRDLYVLELTDGAVAIDAPSSSRDAMTSQAKRFGSDRLAYILRVLGDLNTELRSSTNARLSFEIALTRMVRPESDLTLESLAARIEALESRMSDGAVAVVSPDRNSGCAPLVGSPASASVVPHGAGMPRGEESSTRPTTSIPPASTGYKPFAAEPPRASAPSSDSVTAAMGKVAAFRASTASGFAVDSRPASEPVVQPGRDVPDQQPSTSDASVADGVRSKLLNPAALQRGWQATLSELKRQRAVYAALMQSARIVADSDGSGVAIEFSKENDFAFSAAQKPDVSTALDAALSNAFGGSVPFRFTQGGGVAAAVMVAARNVRPSGSGGPAETARSSASRMPSRFDARGMASSSSAFPTASARMGGFGGEDASAPKAAVVANEGVAPASRAHANAPSAPASVRAESNPYDAPAFDRDDMVPYSDEDAASYVGEDSYADDSYAPASFEGDAHAAASSAVRPNDAGATLEGNRNGAVAPEGDRDADATMGIVGTYDFGVTGPAPVDPYPVGRSLGFDSMPPAKKRPKGTVSAKGWPGVGDASDADVSLARGKADSSDEKMGESRAESERRADSPEGQTGNLPESSSSGPLHGDGGVSNSFVPFDPNTAIDPNKPNPFAGRKMPSGIGGGGGGASFPDSRPAHTAVDGDMGIADIFGAFGVSMDNVREE